MSKIFWILFLTCKDLHILSHLDEECFRFCSVGLTKEEENKSLIPHMGRL